MIIIVHQNANGLAEAIDTSSKKWMRSFLLRIKHVEYMEFLEKEFELSYAFKQRLKGITVQLEAEDLKQLQLMQHGFDEQYDCGMSLDY